MLGVITKKIARQKSPQMVAILSACIVGLHFWGMRQAMWQESSKVKKLKSGKKSRDNPKDNELQFGEENESHIEKHSHNNDLPNGEICLHK